MFRFRRVLVVLVAVATMATGMVITPGAGGVAAAADATVPTQFIARQFAEMLGRAPTPAEWTAWTTFFQGSPACVDELEVLALHLAGITPRTDIDPGTSSTGFAAAYPDPATATLTAPEDIDYTGDGQSNGDDDEFYEHVVRATRIQPVLRVLLGHEVNTYDWANYVADYVAGDVDGDDDTDSDDWEAAVDAIYQLLDPSEPFTRAWIGGPVCSSTSSSYGSALDTGDCAAGAPVAPCPIDVIAEVGDLLGHDVASRDQAAIETALAQPGTVLLKPGEVIRVASDIDILGSRTLRTAGSPATEAYGLMGRINPGGPVCEDGRCSDLGLVAVWGGGLLTNVWVDGQGGDWRQLDMANVETINSGAWVQAHVVDNRLSNPAPRGSALRLRGEATTGYGCVGARGWGNLITDFTASSTLDIHGRPSYADGIVVDCASSDIFDNTIIDITGVGIKVTGPMNRAAEAAGQAQLAQASQVRENAIFNAGHSARAAIALEPLGDCAAYRGPNAPVRAPVPCMDVPGVRYFTGTAITNNELWTSDRARYDIALMIGSRGFWGDAGVDGQGPVTVQGTTSPAAVRATIGIAVGGMSGAKLSGNALTFSLVPDAAPTVMEQCPSIAIGIRSGEALDPTSDVTATTFTEGPGLPLFDGCAYPDASPTGLSRITAVNHGGSTVGLPPECGSLSPDVLYFADGTCEPFTPFGYQWGPHDLPAVGDPAWLEISRDLREIRLSGANIVRYSAELVQYVNQDHSIDAAEMASLVQLVDLAGRAGLYLDLTGAATYETWSATDYPWFNGIAPEDYEQRWQYQQDFYTAAGAALASRSNIAFYDLMNEPYGAPAAGAATTEWCPNIVWDFYCWNQVFLRRGADHPWYTSGGVPVARDWVDTMIDAIEAGVGASGHRPLVSMGTIFPIPGGGFGAEQLIEMNYGPDVAGLDFTMHHDYPGSFFGTTYTMPESADAYATYKAPGRPMINEETFSSNVAGGLLKEGVSESIAAGLERWMLDGRFVDDGSGGETTNVATSGWIGNYLSTAVPAPVTGTTPPAAYWRLHDVPEDWELEEEPVAPTPKSYLGGSALTAHRTDVGQLPDVRRLATGATSDRDGALTLNASGASGDTVLRTPKQDLGNDFTFEGWFRSSVPASQTLWTESSGAAAATIRVLNDGDIQLALAGGGTAARGDATVLDGNWHHIVVTRSGTAANATRIFIDGVETTYVNRTSRTFTSSGADWWFGGSPNGSSVASDLRGDLDDVALYDSALDPAAITAHHVAGTEVPDNDGATMQETAATIATLWPYRHTSGVSSTRETFIPDLISYVLGGGNLFELFGHEPTSSLHLAYMKHDMVRFIQTNAQYLGTSGPGA